MRQMIITLLEYMLTGKAELLLIQPITKLENMNRNFILSSRMLLHSYGGSEVVCVTIEDLLIKEIFAKEITDILI